MYNKSRITALTSAIILIVVGTPHAQDAAATTELSRTLSAVTGAPVGTVLTDLVTKSTPLAIKSNLQRATDVTLNLERDGFVQSTNALLPPQIKDAISRGFAVRDVELDPRFEANIKRIAPQVALDKLWPVAPHTTGLTIGGATGVLGGTATIASTDLTSRDVALPPPEAFGARLADPTVQLSNERVWGGSAIPADSDPYRETVAIVGNNKLCSGTLIASDLVLTAAHCYRDGVMEEVQFGVSIFPPVDRVKVDKTQSKPFRPCDQVARDLSVGDIALLKLEHAVSETPRAVGALPMVRDAAAVRAVGFGRTSNAIGFKYQVNIVIASWQCDGTAGGLGLPDQQVYRCKPTHELVAAGLNRDTCGGDSGGPIYVFGVDTRLYLVGVTSRAVFADRCGPGGIYVLLGASPVREWLEQQGVAFN
jgi:hypothetical protein